RASPRAAGPSRRRPRRSPPRPRRRRRRPPRAERRAHPAAEDPMARLKERYRSEVKPRLKERFKIENEMAVPRLQKIGVNMGVGSAVENKGRVESAAKGLAQITGQRPIVRKAKKAISSFKLREGMPIGCSVTLRGDRMWEFADRLISVVLPR